MKIITYILLITLFFSCTNSKAKFDLNKPVKDISANPEFYARVDFIDSLKGSDNFIVPIIDLDGDKLNGFKYVKLKSGICRIPNHSFAFKIIVADMNMNNKLDEPDRIILADEGDEKILTAKNPFEIKENLNSFKVRIEDSIIQLCINNTITEVEVSILDSTKSYDIHFPLKIPNIKFQNIITREYGDLSSLLIDNKKQLITIMSTECDRCLIKYTQMIQTNRSQYNSDIQYVFIFPNNTSESAISTYTKQL